MAGSFVGGLFYEHSVLTMLTASAALIGVGAAGMAAERQLFDVPTTGQRNNPSLQLGIKPQVNHLDGASLSEARWPLRN